MRSGDGPAGELVTNQDETGSHQGDVGGIGMAPEASGVAPVPHDDQDCGERQELTNLDADVEGEEVRDESVGRYGVFDDLR